MAPSLFISKERSLRVLLGAVLCDIWGRRGEKKPNHLSLLMAVFLRFRFGVGSILNYKFPPVFSQKYSPSWVVG